MSAMFSSFSDTVSGKIGNLSNLTTTDKTNIVSAINEVNKYTIDLGTISGSNFNEFFKNACVAFLQLNPPTKVCNVTVTYSNVNYYYGTFTNVDNYTILANLTVAGGATMWSGYHNTTRNETVIYPYEPIINPHTVFLTAKTVPGLTLTWHHNDPDSHKAFRIGNQVILNVGLDVTGTYTGTEGWVEMFEAPNSLAVAGESFVRPIFTSICHNRTNNAMVDSIHGSLLYLVNGTYYELRFSGQLIYIVYKS